jgi:hypothetical protein|nr:MAG TPA: YopX protein [Caudoviricetes sp.]
MTPRYRAWIKTEKRMFFSDDILAIDYENEEIVTQQVYFENGLPDDRDIYCYNPDEIELMQSTGLKDKNGKEIFEGDILEIQGIKMIVKFGSYKYLETSKNNGHILGILHDGLGFYVECINAADPDRISPFEPETLKESAVIGNIYENKDILEVIDEKRK